MGLATIMGQDEMSSDPTLRKQFNDNTYFQFLNAKEKLEPMIK